MKVEEIRLRNLGISQLNNNISIGRFSPGFDGILAGVPFRMNGALFNAEVAGRIGRIGSGRVAVRRRFSHAGKPIERRRFRPLDQAIQSLDRLQFCHHLVDKPIRTGPRQIQHHTLRLMNGIFLYLRRPRTKLP